jgi:hypothetical protein
VFRISDVAAPEGAGVFTFTVTPSPVATTATTVQYRTGDVTASAASGDYVAAAGTLMFLVGQSSATIEISVNQDNVNEADETFFVVLSTAVGAMIGQQVGVGTIVNDDPVPQITIASVSVAGGHAGQSPAQFVVSLSSPSAQFIAVDYATSDVAGAIAGLDYVAGAGRLVFPPGSTSQIISVAVLGDMTREPDESFGIFLSNAVNAVLVAGAETAIGTIVNDDPEPTITIGNAVAGEGDYAVFTVTLSNPSLST